MKESRITIDARGLPCPEPVIKLKKAIEEGTSDTIEIVVDNPAARENVTRYAKFSGCEIVGNRDEGEGARITLKPRPGSPTPMPHPESSFSETHDAPVTVFISSDKIGKGDDDLGTLLMRGFVFTLAESERKPRRVILMNSGVRLSCEGSDSLVNLLRLEEEGVDILSCGTCLEFLKLKDSLKAGRISNMYEIAGFLLEGRTLSV